MQIVAGDAGRRGARLRNAIAAGAVIALCMTPAVSGGTAATTSDGYLGVNAITFGDESLSTIVLQSSEGLAKVSLFVPQSHTLTVAEPAGTRVGEVVVFVGDAAGGFGDFVDGELVVDDPAKYASDPSAQACAPGSHAAVWRATLAAPRRGLELAVFVDPAAEPAGGAHVLSFCPMWPSSAVGVAHLVGDGFGLYLEDVLRPPTAAGRHTWSALLTPTGPGSLTPEPGRAFELRAIVSVPRVLTLRAKHDARSKSVVLSGRLLTLGQPDAGVEISFSSYVPGTEDLESFGPVRTNASGEFSVRRRVEQTTEYRAGVVSAPRPCAEPSTAPGGCVSETVTPPSSAQAAVVVRKRTAPRLVPRRQDRALARAANLKATDFPAGWFVVPLLRPFEICPSFAPNLSALTATGEAWSQGFASDTGSAVSTSAVYSTVAEARVAFGKQAVRRVADCYAADARDAGATIVSVGPVSYPALGQQTRAFRVVVSDDVLTGYVDLVSFRRGRVVVHLYFASADAPLDIARSLAATISARARGS